jgi:hypothetical protein
MEKECVYAARPRDPNEDRFDRLEGEIMALRHQIITMQSQAPPENLVSSGATQNVYSQVSGHTPGLISENVQHSGTAWRTDGHPLNPVAVIGASPHSGVSLPAHSPVSVAGQKRKRTHVEVRDEPSVDFVTRGLMSYQDATLYFAAWFQGCDRFVPIFDPSYDTAESIRSRSSLLFNAICTIGCTLSNTDIQTSHMLNFELKKMLNQVVMTRETQPLETVQALLVVACYSNERSLLLSFALRLALELGLHETFEQLLASVVSNETTSASKMHLMRCSRIWFQLLVLENMLQVDAGKLPSLFYKGTRRCRLLLQQEGTVALDLRLLSQVELNYLRTKIHDRLAACDGSADEDVLEHIQGARIDIDLWFNDWKTFVNASNVAQNERPTLLINLQVQRQWCEAMAYFRALKCLGTENIEAMSPAGRQILTLAKNALRAHLATTLEEPYTYLRSLRYAMDFSWAKCAFCFLLLLKLTRLLPESDENNYKLLEDGNKLYQQLSAAGNCAASSASRLYVQVLGMSLEKYGRALHEHEAGSGTTFFWETNANIELQNFLPEQFVFEWSFPGLTLFSNPMAWQNFVDDYLLGFGAEGE